MAVSTPGYCTLTATARPSRQQRPVDLPDAGRRDRFRLPVPEHALGLVAQLLPDDRRGQARGHRRRIGLQRGQCPLGLLGQPLEDEAEQLADLHHRALHLAELAGGVLRRADHEAGVELGPPLIGRAGTTHLVGGPVRAAPGAEAPHPCRTGDAGASVGIAGDGRPDRHCRGRGGEDGRAEGQPPAAHHAPAALPGDAEFATVESPAVDPAAGGRRRATGSAASRSSGSGSPVTSQVQ